MSNGQLGCPTQGLQTNVGKEFQLVLVCSGFFLTRSSQLAMQMGWIVKKKIMELANEWSDYADITFESIGSRQGSDIRVGSAKKGYYSKVGTDASSVDIKDNTMNLHDHHLLNKILPGTVRHEFGHALGLYHEHQLSGTQSLLIPYNEKATFKYYTGAPNHWHRNQVKHNILQPRQLTGIHKLKRTMDQFSVMMYPVKMDLLTKQDLAVHHFGTAGQSTLSAEDRIHIGRMYPRQPKGFQLSPANFKCQVCHIGRQDLAQDEMGKRWARVYQYCKQGKCMCCALSRTGIKCMCPNPKCKSIRSFPYEASSDDALTCGKCGVAAAGWKPILS